jgi:hypothetical protein
MDISWLAEWLLASQGFCCMELAPAYIWKDWGKPRSISGSIADDGYEIRVRDYTEFEAGRQLIIPASLGANMNGRAPSL